ncbi:alpha/beta fold hydrolase [Nesterenkonia sp. PF2B19]|uniref:alpha/beta fold hydrolase n=1 Tax=Nesterenkonia sp. PF2B19 TaxID=1881858 RepID=UPI000AF424E0|nr:alpha/beta hydrolase [Nesterenkonia sp. PF2B19]
MSHDAVLLPEPTFIDVDGVAVATWLLEPDGPPRGPDVVLCHGTPWSAAVWSAAARHLARHRRVRLWDMPGYGASAKEEQVPVDLGSQMRRFAQLLDRWRLSAPSVIAHDIGGAVALGAHLLHGRDYAPCISGTSSRWSRGAHRSSASSRPIRRSSPSFRRSCMPPWSASTSPEPHVSP